MKDLALICVPSRETILCNLLLAALTLTVQALNHTDRNKCLNIVVPDLAWRL